MYKRRWSDILRFRSRNLFTTCEVCFALKQALNDKNNSLESKLVVLKQYRAHLHSQYCDRTIIWRLQSESAEPQTPILLIGTDGMDQSKFAIPREPELKNNAALSLGLINMQFFRSSPYYVQPPQKMNPLTLLKTNADQVQTPKTPCQSTWSLGFRLHSQCFHHG